MSSPRILIVEPLARCTGHHSWYLIKMANAFQAAGASVTAVTFSGFHGEDENPIPGWAVYETWGPLRKRLYRSIVRVSTERVVPSEYSGKWGQFQYVLFSHLSNFAVTAAAVSYADKTPGIQVFIPEPLTLFSAINLLRRRRPCATLMTSFGPPPHIAGGWGPGATYRRLLRLVLRRLIARGDFRVVVQTPPLLEDWVEAFGDKAVSLIPIGVGRASLSIDRSSAKQRLGLPADKPIAAVLGAIRPAKGYIELFSAFRGYPKPCYFLLAGDWPEWAPPDPRHVARKNDCFNDTLFWLRFVPEEEFSALISAVDVVVLLYQNPDGSSGILSRCLEAGTPVLATSKGHLGAFTLQTRAGRVADPDRPDEVREALGALLSQRPAEQNQTDEPADWASVAMRHLDLLVAMRSTS